VKLPQFQRLGLPSAALQRIERSTRNEYDMQSPSPPPGKASDQLVRLGESLEGESGDIALGEVIDRLGASGIGMTLLLLTLPALIPVPGPFGLVFGSIVAFVSLQVMAGARRLWLPGLIRDRRMPVTTVRTFVNRGAPILQRIEEWFRPRRMLPLTGRFGRMVLGVPLILMGVAVALPVPMGNVPPAASLIMLSLGLINRDGLAVIIGLALCVFAVIWFVVLFLFGAEILAFLVSLVGF